MNRIKITSKRLILTHTGLPHADLDAFGSVWVWHNFFRYGHDSWAQKSELTLGAGFFILSVTVGLYQMHLVYGPHYVIIHNSHYIKSNACTTSIYNLRFNSMWHSVSDACHTLTCAIMLLNTDLHGTQVCVCVVGNVL